MKARTGNLYKRQGTFYVRWRVDGKLFSKSTGETDRRKAEVKRREIMEPFQAVQNSDVLTAIASRIEGDKALLAAADDTVNPPLRIADAWAAFTKSPRRPDCGPVTLRYYGYQWQRFEEWTDTRAKDAVLRDVDAATAEAYAADLTAANVSPNTYNKHLALLQLVFRVLGQTPAHKITGNPWGNIQRRRLTTHSHRELTVEELRKVCTVAEGELRTLLAIGLYTGLRLADAATLQWGEVDLTRGLIQRVPRKTARRTGKAVQIPIHRILATIFTEIPAKQRRGPVLPELCAKYNADGYSVPRQIQAHFEACGIATHAPGTGRIKDETGKEVSTGKRALVDVGFHSLRHTFVSLCRAANTPLSVVESIVGHSSPAMTQHYTHTGEAAARSAIAMLPGLSEGPRRTPAARLARLLDKVQKMPDAKVKSAILRLLKTRIRLAAA